MRTWFPMASTMPRVVTRGFLMIVMAFEKVPASLRGELSRWLLEVQTNVFVGTVSALVREKLWELACSKVRDGHCTLINHSNNEQGFRIVTHGPSRRLTEDFEGLQLIRIPSDPKGEKRAHRHFGGINH
jgi:CRISPR-associated protein Cas2